MKAPPRQRSSHPKEFLRQSDAERETLSKATEAGGEYLWEEEAEGKGERRFICFVL